jgi:hypothetical protein
MKSWTIFTHSMRQVFGNLPAALRISGVIYLGMILLISLVVRAYLPRMFMMVQPGHGGELAGFVLSVSLIALAGSIWIGVAWHRYVLLVETTGLVPPLRARRMLGYLGNSLLIAVILVILIGVPGFLMMRVAGSGGRSLAVAVLTAIWLAALVISLRLSTALPGSALGARQSIADAWRATSGSSLTILGLAIIVGVFSWLLSKAGQPFLRFGLVPFAVATAVTTWISMMVGFSVLTTLYGHYIEKRPLV